MLPCFTIAIEWIFVFAQFSVWNIQTEEEEEEKNECEFYRAFMRISLANKNIHAKNFALESRNSQVKSYKNDKCHQP